MFDLMEAFIANNTLSVMSLLGTNALCLKEIIWDRISFNLLIIVLTTILYTKLYKLPGLYLMTFLGLTILKIRAI